MRSASKTAAISLNRGSGSLYESLTSLKRLQVKSHKGGLIQFVDISLENEPEGQVFKRILIILDYEDNEGHRYEDLCVFIKPKMTVDAKFTSVARKYELNVKPGYLYVQYDNDMYDTPVKTFEIWSTEEGIIRILENTAYY